MTGETSGPPVVVTLPDVIDYTNAEDTAAALLGARGNPGLIIADMTRTTFSDSMGMRMLIVTGERAAATGSELRVVIAPGGSVARKMAILSMERVVPVYAGIQEAMEPPAEAGQPTGTVRPTAVVGSRAAP